MDESRITTQFGILDWACVIIRINSGGNNTHTGIAYKDIDQSHLVMTHMKGHERFGLPHEKRARS